MSEVGMGWVWKRCRKSGDSNSSFLELKTSFFLGQASSLVIVMASVRLYLQWCQFIILTRSRDVTISNGLSELVTE